MLSDKLKNLKDVKLEDIVRVLVLSAHPAVSSHEGIDIFKFPRDTDEEWFLKIPKKDAVEAGISHIIRGHWLYKDKSSHKLVELGLIPPANYGTIDGAPYIATKKMGSELDLRRRNMELNDFSALLCCLFVPKENLRESTIVQKYSGKSLWDTIEERNGADLKLFLTEVIHRGADYLDRVPELDLKEHKEEIYKMLKTLAIKINSIEDTLPMPLMWIPTDLLPRNITSIKAGKADAETYTLHFIDQFKPTESCPLYGPPQFIIDFYEKNVAENAYPDLFHPTPIESIKYLVQKLKEAYEPVIAKYSKNLNDTISEVLGSYWTCREIFKTARQKAQLQLQKEGAVQSKLMPT